MNQQGVAKLLMRTDGDSESCLAFWKAILNLSAINVVFHRISIFQVCDECCKPGKNFVGVTYKQGESRAVIHHTCKLTEEDILHELLHVKFPNWSEERVVRATDELLKTKLLKPRRQVYGNRVLQCENQSEGPYS